jgi:hypothetical protein
MRYLSFTLAILSFSLLVGFSQAFVGPTCTKMHDNLGDKPDTIFKQFSSIICNKGCKPIIAHYDRWAKKNVVMPMIKYAMKKMGLPQHERTIHKLADHVVATVKAKCKPQLGKQHLCEDPETLENFGRCLKAQLMPVVMENIGGLMPLVAEPICKKEFSYLQKDDLWERVIPGFFHKYAGVCTQL